MQNATSPQPRNLSKTLGQAQSLLQKYWLAKEVGIKKIPNPKHSVDKKTFLTTTQSTITIAEPNKSRKNFTNFQYLFIICASLTYSLSVRSIADFCLFVKTDYPMTKINIYVKISLLNY